jgi:hypothetical protein
MKIIITNKQYNTLVENITNDTDIDEGVGEFVKSVLGSFSKKKSIYKNPIDVEVRNSFTKNLDADIRKRDKEFPNNKRDLDFENTLLRIKAVYDKIKLSTYLKPEDSDFLSVDDANWAIDTLIMYLYEIYDKNLKSVYKSFRATDKSKTRGGKLIGLVNSMKRVKENEIPVHKTKPKRKSVPRGTPKKSTPPKPTNPVPTPPQSTIKKGDLMWYKGKKIIVTEPNIDKDHSMIRYDGETIQFPAINQELKPI